MIVLVKEHVEVNGKIARHDFLVPCKNFLQCALVCGLRATAVRGAYSEGSESIGRNFE